MIISDFCRAFCLNVGKFHYFTFFSYIFFYLFPLYFFHSTFLFSFLFISFLFYSVIIFSFVIFPFDYITFLSFRFLFISFSFPHWSVGGKSYQKYKLPQSYCNLLCFQSDLIRIVLKLSLSPVYSRDFHPIIDLCRIDRNAD